MASFLVHSRELHPRKCNRICRAPVPGCIHGADIQGVLAAAQTLDVSSSDSSVVSQLNSDHSGLAGSDLKYVN